MEYGEFDLEEKHEVKKESSPIKVMNKLKICHSKCA